MPYEPLTPLPGVCKSDSNYANSIKAADLLRVVLRKKVDGQNLLQIN